MLSTPARTWLHTLVAHRVIHAHLEDDGVLLRVGPPTPLPGRAEPLVPGVLLTCRGGAGQRPVGGEAGLGVGGRNGQRGHTPRRKLQEVVEEG